MSTSDPVRRCNMPFKTGCEHHRCGLPTEHPGTHQCGDCGNTWSGESVTASVEKVDPGVVYSSGMHYPKGSGSHPLFECNRRNCGPPL